MAHFLSPLLRNGDAQWTLVQATTGQILADRLHAAFDSASRRSGLLREATWPAGSALVIAPCQAVHTIGMRFPIDVLFVDRDGCVVKTRGSLGPWRMAAAWRAFAAIELPAGSVKDLVRAGDRVRLALAASGPSETAELCR
jgi:uncharacterized membrane protein (UPF0127 family)